MSSVGEHLTFEGGGQNLKCTTMFDEHSNFQLAIPPFVPIARPVNHLHKSVTFKHLVLIKVTV